MTVQSWAVSAFGACALALAPQCWGENDVHTRTLGNGMKILVKEDRRAPLVVSMVWYRCGSMDESTGSTGVAHVLEHMMFKGTPNVPAGELSRRIARAGGRDNAFTNKDATAYHQQLHKANLALALELEADRMTNLALSDEAFATEIKKVVMEERRLRTDDQPRALLFEALSAVAYEAHPYRTPVVGWMADLENMRAEDARDWYRRWYAPNNATLVVVGDIDAEDVFVMAEQAFGAIPARVLPVLREHGEPRQLGTRRVVVRAPAELPYLILGWHVPSMRDVERDWEPYALWVLAEVLDGGDAARLTRALVRDTRVAISAGASYDPLGRGPAQFRLSGVPAQGRTPEELDSQLRAQVARIAREGVSAEELQRVQAQAVAARVFELDSMFNQAMMIGALDNAGLPPGSGDVQIARIQAVTAEQVQEVAQRYFSDDNLTVGLLEPVVPTAPEKPVVPAAIEVPPRAERQ